MKHPFVIYQKQYGGELVWVGESLTLKGCVSQGDTIDEAFSELESNEQVWLEFAPEVGIEIPSTLIQNKRKILDAMIETKRLMTGYYDKTTEQRVQEICDAINAIPCVSEEEAKSYWEAYKQVRGR